MSDAVPLWLDREGKPIDWRAWISYSRDASYREIADDLVDGCRVLTSWLGINAPSNRLYETVVLDREYPGSGMDGMAWRWLDEAAAKEGHRRVCEIVGVLRSQHRRGAGGSRPGHAEGVQT